MSEELIKQLCDAAGLICGREPGIAALLREAAAALSRPAPAVQVPEGWALVPVEPTPEMLAATSWPGCAATDYEHMLAAAPAPAPVATAALAEIANTPLSEPVGAEECRLCGGDGKAEFGNPCIRCGGTGLEDYPVATAATGKPALHVENVMAQGGGVDVEKVMALVEEYGEAKWSQGDSQYRRGCQSSADYYSEDAGRIRDRIRALLSASPAGVGGFDILKRNAARYQWVRHNAGYTLYCKLFGDVGMREFTDHDLDYAIDRQIRNEAWRPAYQPYLTDNGARWVHDCRNSDRTFLAHLSPCPHCGVAAPAIANQEEGK